MLESVRGIPVAGSLSFLSYPGSDGSKPSDTYTSTHAVQDRDSTNQQVKRRFTEADGGFYFKNPEPLAV
ncbi:hypothetical protein C900_01176 [Fulvivirga imtechensis AK7]|uniref:Uncharacterized protein n=1 Tax=Fulvivirga imtechensis AK7 TaxID=1237149 RepID=L8JKX6_9BACT|nr:hypothetical protein C900_01176 [Fulvivirga imtechensis AK7]